MTISGINVKLSNILSLTKNIELGVKSSLLKSKPMFKAFKPERLFGSMASIKTERLAKLFYKTRTSKSVSLVMESEIDTSTTSNWIASRRSEIYQEYCSENDSTPRAKNTALWPTPNTVPGVEAVTTTMVVATKEETSTFPEILCNGDMALERKMSTMINNCQGQSKITKSQIAPEEVLLLAAEDVVASPSKTLGERKMGIMINNCQGQSKITKSQIAPEEVYLPAAKDVVSSSVALEVQKQRTPVKFGVEINCGVFNCVAGCSSEG